MMRVEETRIEGVLLVNPVVHSDGRGSFMESWNQERYREIGIGHSFVQDNLSFSQRRILRGLHIQSPGFQGKLVSALAGEVYDIAVDLRRGSPTFGRWVGVHLSAASARQIWIPEGFAHGFMVTSETALVGYKCTRTYNADEEIVIRWDDPDLAIEWPGEEPILSDKDAGGLRLRDLPAERLYPATAAGMA